MSKGHKPNAETRRALRRARSGKGLTSYANADEMFAALGISVEKRMPEISQEELDILRAGHPATVAIDAAEYQRLKANQATGIDPVVHQRVVARLAEVEQLLRRELQEHQAEIAAMTKRLEHK